MKPQSWFHVKLSSITISPRNFSCLSISSGCYLHPQYCAWYKADVLSWSVNLGWAIPLLALDLPLLLILHLTFPYLQLWFIHKTPQLASWLCILWLWPTTFFWLKVNCTALFLLSQNNSPTQLSSHQLSVFLISKHSTLMQRGTVF